MAKRPRFKIELESGNWSYRVYEWRPEWWGLSGDWYAMASFKTEEEASVFVERARVFPKYVYDNTPSDPARY